MEKVKVSEMGEVKLWVKPAMAERLLNVQLVIPPFPCPSCPPCYILPIISQRLIGPLLASYFFKALINSDRALSWLPLARKYPPDSSCGCRGQFLCWGHLRPGEELFLSQVASSSNLQPAAEEGNQLSTTGARMVTMWLGKKLQSAGGCAGRATIFTFLSFLLQILDAHRLFFPPESEPQQSQFEVYPKIIMWLFFVLP